jgi:hypothetical protein
MRIVVRQYPDNGKFGQSQDVFLTHLPNGRVVCFASIRNQCISREIARRRTRLLTNTMPQSRELQNKKNMSKDRQSRGRAGSGHEPKKGGAGSHNWGSLLEQASPSGQIDRADPNYDSSGEK